MLRLIYTFFLGLLLAIFIGMGVATFYPEPKPPEYPATLQRANEKGKELTAYERNAESKYNRDFKAYENKEGTYNRNVSIVVLASAVALLAISLVMHPKIDVVSDGLLLGGVFTLLYSIGRSFASNNPKVSFSVVSVGLVITLIMGYRKFAIPTGTTGGTKKKK